MTYNAAPLAIIPYFSEKFFPLKAFAPLWFLFLLVTAPAYSQQQAEIDSLEQVLFSIDKNNTAAIITLAEKLIAKTDSEEKQCYYLGAIVASYASKNEKEKSIPYLYRAKEIAEKAGDPELICRVYTTIASLNQSLKLYNNSRVYLQKAQAIAEKMPHGNERHSLVAFVDNEWGSFYYSTGDYEKSNRFHKLALAEFDKLDSAAVSSASKFYRTSTLYHFGRSFLFLNEPDSAKVYLDRALAAKETTYPNLQYLIKTSLAEAYTLSGGHQRAIDTLLVMVRDPKFDMNELKAEVYLCLSKNYRALKDFSNYSLYNEKYLDVLPLAEGEDLKAINTLFDAENRLFAESASESAFRTRILVYLVIFLIIAGAVTFYLLYRKRRRQQKAYRSVIQHLENKLSVATPAAVPVGKGAEPHQVSIPPQVEEEILEKLVRFESSEEFTNQNLTIASLAVQLNTNTTYLSDIINRNKGKNFNSYINELRINNICEKIYTNPAYRTYKISYLATECGFASHSAFATVFKNITGISPSVFLKQAQKLDSK